MSYEMAVARHTISAILNTTIIHTETVNAMDDVTYEITVLVKPNREIPVNTPSVGSSVKIKIAGVRPAALYADEWIGVVVSVRLQDLSTVRHGIQRAIHSGS